MWEYLWTLPQAVMWEELAIERVVGRYARLAVKSEGPDSTAALCSEVRQIEDRLGLTPMSLKRLQWDIEPLVNRAGLLLTPADVTKIDDYRDL